MLSVNDLYISYGDTAVVKSVSFEVQNQEIVGIVGESGCGKSTVLQSIMNLSPQAKITHGEILLDNVNLVNLSDKEWKEIRGKEIAMIFQNSSLAMNPLKCIDHLFYEVVSIHDKRKKKEEIKQNAEELMQKLRLKDTERILKSYPFELSGGMCQRIAIAAAMINNPKLILADEPTSALDVTAQAQVVKMMKQLREEFHTSMVIVTHSMGVVAQLADKIAVMYGGSIVEWGTAKEVLNNPMHPYTQALIEAIPQIDGQMVKGIPGRPPEFTKNISGCSFAPRCTKAASCCKTKNPHKIFISDNHWIQCMTSQEKGE